MPMTNEEYVQHSGTRCPFCRSRNILAGSFEAAGRTSWQNVSCDDCGFSWQDEYVLTGWTDEFSDNPIEGRTDQ